MVKRSVGDEQQFLQAGLATRWRAFALDRTETLKSGMEQTSKLGPRFLCKGTLVQLAYNVNVNGLSREAKRGSDQAPQQSKSKDSDCNR